METLNNNLQLSYSPHPLLPAAGRDLRAVIVEPGDTLAEVLTRADVDSGQLITVAIDGELIPVSAWHVVCPQPGQLLTVQAALAGGGDGGSNPMVAVLSIGLMLVAPYAATGLYAAIGGTFVAANAGFVIGALTVGITVAGNLLIGAIFAPHMPQLSNASGRFNQPSPTYSLSGGSNRLRPYEPLLVPFGRHVVFADYASKPYTELVGSDQYLYQIFHFGLGDVSLDEFRIGETPLENYQDVTLFWPDANGVLANFPGNVDTTAGATLTSAAGWITRSTPVGTTKIALDIEGALYAIDSSTGSPAALWVVVDAEYRPAGGAWAPFFQSPNGYASFYWSRGYWGVTGFSLSGGGGVSTWIQVAAGSKNYADHVDGAAAGTSNGMATTWRWRPYTDINGGVAGAALTAPAPAQAGTQDIGPATISNSTTTPVRKCFSRSVPSGQYEVRIKRVTADFTDNTKIGTLTLTQMRSYQEDLAAYPGEARVGMYIKASNQLQGVVQQLSAVATACTYVWGSGAWEYGPTRNPAWWFLDFARGRRDANGRKLYGCFRADAQIDIEAIKSWAVFCDDFGLTFDAVLDRSMAAEDWLNVIARCGLGSVSRASGKLGVVWDAVDQPAVATANMANIISGSMSIQYITEALADEIVVTYVDPDDGWQQKQVRALAPGVTTPQRTTQIEMMGCTSKDMAGLFANAQAAAQTYRRRRITWEQDFEGFVVTRGDVVLLSHDLTQWGYSGRVVSFVDTTHVQLDRQVPRSGAVEYLAFTKPDGTIDILNVVAGGAGTNSDTLTLATPYTPDSTKLAMDHRWQFSPLATPGKKVKIVGVTPVSTSRVRLLATDEVPEYYAAWSGTWSEPAQQTLLRPQVPGVAGVAAVETLVMVGRVVESRVNITWTTSGNYAKGKLRWRMDGGAWVEAGDYLATSAQIDLDVVGVMEIVVQPLGPLGEPGTAAGTSLTLIGKTAAPADVPWFSLDAMRLSWGPIADLDLDGYRIRYQFGVNRSWGDANPMHEGLIVASPYTMLARPAGQVTLMIKAVDTLGNESQNPAVIVTDLGDALVDNLIETIDLKALGWPGQIVNGSIDGATGDLIADEAGTMWSDVPETSMWTLDSNAMWHATTWKALQYLPTITPGTVADQAQLRLDYSIEADNYDIEFRRDGPAPMWSQDSEAMWGSASAPMWELPPGYVPTFMWGSSGDAMWAADSERLMWAFQSGGYQTWPGEVTAFKEPYSLWIDCGFGITRGRISTLKVLVDAPDIVEYFNDITLAAGGTRLPVTNSYRNIKNVLITLQDNGGSARSVKVMDKSPTLGPLVQAFDAGGGGTGAKIDATLQGY